MKIEVVKDDDKGNVTFEVDQEGLEAIVAGLSAIDLVNTLVDASTKGPVGQVLVMAALQSIDKDIKDNYAKLQKKMKEWN